MDLGRWQPDIIGISFARRKIAIAPKLSLPSDSWPEALHEVHSWKCQSYHPLITALQSYINSGWTVYQILPWIIGARGMVSVDLLTPALEFLEIPKQKWSSIIEASVCASVEELVYMHRILFSLSSQSNTFDTDDCSQVTEPTL